MLLRVAGVQESPPVVWTLKSGLERVFGTVGRGKLVVQVKLLPAAEQAAALWSTLQACNEAAAEVARVAFETGVFREYALRKPTYGALRARYTSQMCPRCGHTDRANRPTRDHFCCRRCGLAGPADVVAAVNVRNRARSAWVHINVPEPTAA